MQRSLDCKWSARRDHSIYRADDERVKSGESRKSIKFFGDAAFQTFVFTEQVPLYSKHQHTRHQ
jgi:hypothetical protein